MPDEKHDAAHYDGLTGAVEGPDAPNPVSHTAILARKRAAKQGRLLRRARDEHRPPPPAPVKPKATKAKKAE